MLSVRLGVPVTIMPWSRVNSSSTRLSVLALPDTVDNAADTSRAAGDADRLSGVAEISTAGALLGPR